MPQEQKRIPILLSLHEPYFEEIKSGIKRYEYRKRYVEQPSIAYIYCTSPVKAVKGIVVFDTPIIGPPELISDISEKETGEGALTAEYLKGKDKGYAIPVVSWQEIESISLDELRDQVSGFVPPQSYYRLDNKPELLEYLESKRVVGLTPVPNSSSYSTM
jgi:predicted transcriptional regulator